MAPACCQQVASTMKEALSNDGRACAPRKMRTTALSLLTMKARVCGTYLVAYSLLFGATLSVKMAPSKLQPLRSHDQAFMR